MACPPAGFPQLSSCAVRCGLAQSTREQSRPDGEGIGGGSIAGLGCGGSQGCMATGWGGGGGEGGLSQDSAQPAGKAKLGAQREHKHQPPVEESPGDIAQGGLDRRAWQASWRGRHITLGNAVAFLCMCALPRTPPDTRLSWGRPSSRLPCLWLSTCWCMLNASSGGGSGPWHCLSGSAS